MADRAQDKTNEPDTRPPTRHEGIVPDAGAPGAERHAPETAAPDERLVRPDVPSRGQTRGGQGEMSELISDTAEEMDQRGSRSIFWLLVAVGLLVLLALFFVLLG